MLKYKAVEFFSNYTICEGDPDTVIKAINTWVDNNPSALIEVFKFNESTGQWTQIN